MAGATEWLLLCLSSACLATLVSAGSAEFALKGNGAEQVVYLTEGSLLTISCEESDSITELQSAGCPFPFTSEEPLTTSAWSATVMVDRTHHNTTCTCVGVFENNNPVTLSLNILVASVPTIEIQNCPTDTDSNPAPVTIGSSNSCTCVVTDLFPSDAGTIEWLAPNGTAVVSGTTEAVLTFQQDFTDVELTTFTCRATNNFEASNPRYSTNITYDQLFNVPSTIVAFSGNSDSDSLEVAAGTDIAFVCEAEGFPRPEISVRGQHSGQSLSGLVTPVDKMGNKFQLTRPVACDESDTFACTANNGIGSPAEKTLTVIVKCPPQFYEPKASRSNQVLPVPRSRSGLFQAVFFVICRPAPVGYKLIKLASTASTAKRAAGEIVMDPEHYRAAFQEVDLTHGQISLDVFDPNVGEDDRYRLDVSNSDGADLQISFVTVLDSAPSKSGNSKSSSALIAVGCVATVLIIFLVVLAVYVIMLRQQEKRKTIKTKSQSGPRVVVVQQPEVPMQRVNSLLWRQRNF